MFMEKKERGGVMPSSSQDAAVQADNTGVKLFALVLSVYVI